MLIYLDSHTKTKSSDGNSFYGMRSAFVVFGKIVCIIATTIASAGAMAAVDCEEIIMGVINHSNGNVYFTTDKSCGNGWCMLSGNSDYVKRDYATLLTAQLAGKKIWFRWPGTTCTQNGLYAVPDILWTTN